MHWKIASLVVKVLNKSTNCLIGQSDVLYSANQMASLPSSCDLENREFTAGRSIKKVGIIIGSCKAFHSF